MTKSRLSPRFSRHFKPALAGAMLMACALPLLAGCSDASDDGEHQAAPVAAPAGDVAVAGASLRLNPNPAAPSAAYFTLTGGARDATLVSITSPDAARAEMHESKMDGGMMTMAPLTSVPVPAGGTVEFRQGGMHVMVFDISAAALAAGKVKLVLTFADGRTLEADLTFPAQVPTPPSTGAIDAVAAPAATPVAKAAPAPTAAAPRAAAVAPSTAAPASAPTPPAADPHAGMAMDHSGH